MTTRDELPPEILRMIHRLRADAAEGLLPDHACLRCVPHSNVLIDGHACAYHRAEDLLGTALRCSECNKSAHPHDGFDHKVSRVYEVPNDDAR